MVIQNTYIRLLYHFLGSQLHGQTACTKMDLNISADFGFDLNILISIHRRSFTSQQSDHSSPP